MCLVNCSRRVPVVEARRQNFQENFQSLEYAEEQLSESRLCVLSEWRKKKASNPPKRGSAKVITSKITSINYSELGTSTGNRKTLMKLLHLNLTLLLPHFPHNRHLRGSERRRRKQPSKLWRGNIFWHILPLFNDWRRRRWTEARDEGGKIEKKNFFRKMKNVNWKTNSYRVSTSFLVHSALLCGWARLHSCITWKWIMFVSSESLWLFSRRKNIIPLILRLGKQNEWNFCENLS